MNDPGSVGSSQGSTLVTGQETSANKAVPAPEGSAFGFSVKVVDAKPQKGLRDVVRNFIPLPLYKFVVKLFASNSGEQKKLGQQIAELRKTNKEAWDALGQSKAQGTERYKRQLACQESQLQLDYIEGRKTSPVTTQRSKVVQALKQAITDPSPESDRNIIKAFELLKAATSHEVALKADLMLEKRKIPALEQRIARAEPIIQRLGLENSGLLDEKPLSIEQQQLERRVLDNARDAKEELDVVKMRVRILKAEIQQFEKMLVEEEAAMEAYQRYGRSKSTVKQER